MHVIENDHASLGFDPQTGRLISLRNEGRGVEFVGEPALAESLRLLVPGAGNRGRTLRPGLADWFQGGADAVRFGWNSLPSDGGALPVRVEVSWTLMADGAAAEIRIDNASECTVEEIHGPSLAGLSAPGEDAEPWRLIRPDGSGLGHVWNPFREVQNAYLGPAEPAKVFPAISMPWMDLYHESDRHGLYLAHEDPRSSFSAWWFQVTPDADWAGDHWSWPAGDGPRGLCVSRVCFPHIPPGGSWTSPPFVIRFHDAIWYEAARLYREFYDRNFPISRQDAWLWREDAWQTTILLYPEDTVTHRFSDIPRLARDALGADIRVLQLDGWDIGGIDRDYPHYEPDPRLGGEEELRRAISECEAMGVKVLLFSNLFHVHLETDWFREELHRYTMRNIHGDCVENMGWEYETAGGLLGFRKPRMVSCNPAHPGFARIMDRAYTTIAALGAAGSQVDKITQGPTLDFHPGLPPDLPRDQSWSRPCLEAFDRHRRIGRGHRADYALVAETHWDRLFPLVEVAYARHWYRDRPQLTGATFPEFKQTCCITGGHDFALVNHAIRLGLVINIEARCLHAGAGAVPSLVAHVRKARGLRSRLADLLWFGRMTDPHGCVGEADPGWLATRYRNEYGDDALVCCHWEDRTLGATLRFDGNESAELHDLEGGIQTVRLPCRVDVAPGSLVVLVGRNAVRGPAKALDRMG